eukprot:UN09058
MIRILDTSAVKFELHVQTNSVEEPNAQVMWVIIPTFLALFGCLWGMYFSRKRANKEVVFKPTLIVEKKVSYNESESARSPNR